MFVVENYAAAVFCCVITMFCWGSWANTQRLAGKTWRFELFYWDYAFGTALMILILGLTLGSFGETGRSLLADIRQAEPGPIGSAILGGVVFNAANILLVAAIDIAGMAVAFPVGIGLALVLGVLLNYWAEPQGNPTLLFAGVGLIVAAMVCAAVAHRARPGQAAAGGVKGLLLSLVSGLLMGSFYRFVAASMSTDFNDLEGGKLGPYSALLFFAVGLLASNFVFNTAMMWWPIRGATLSAADYFRGTARDHLCGILGGATWAVGMALSIVAAGQAGFAISYGLGQGATLVAACWGVFIWKEFRDARPGTGRILTLMFAGYLLGLGLIIASGGLEKKPKKDGIREFEARPDIRTESTPGKGSSAADEESKVIILQPGPHEQEIDVKPQNEAIATLAKGSRRERSDLVDKIKAAPQKYAPPVFFELAYVLWERGDKDDAVIWYLFGIVRGSFDTMRCADRSAQDAVGVMKMTFGERVGEDFFKYLKADKDRLKKLFLAAIDTDRKTPYDYDHRWINLHGLGAIAGALGDESQSPESLPKDQWADLAEKNRQRFIEGLARKESPTGLGSPKEFFDQPAVVALAEAVEQGNLPEIDRLVAAGADVNAIGSRGKQSDASEQFNLLTWAMRAKQKKAFERLLEHKADPNGQFQNGVSVTSIAAADPEDSDWLEMALAHGANPNLVNPSDEIGVQKTPLFDSIRGEGNRKNLELLIKAGADLNARNRFQRTAAIEAAEWGEFEIVIQLLSAGADFRLRDKDGHDVIYHIIDRFRWENTDEQRLKLISLLREKDADFSEAEKEVAKTDPAAYAAWKKFLDEHPAGKPAP